MENKVITLDLSIEEINIVLGSLSKMPYETVATVIDKVSKQAQDQVNSNITQQEEYHVTEEV